MGENPGDGSREINQSKRTAFHPSFYTKFWKGAQEAVQGTIVAVKNPVVKEHYKKILKQTLLLMIITYSLAFVFYVLPLKFFYFIFGWDVNEEGNFELTVLMQVGYIVPHVYFIIVELFFNQIIEDLFFVTLGEQNEPLSKYLMGLPKLPRWKTIQTILKRNVMYLGIGIVLQFLSLLPVVGYFVFPAASTIFHMKIVGKEVSLVLGILSLIPVIQPYSKMILKVMLISYSTSRHLLLPYTQRLSSAEEYRYLNRRYFGTLLGFSMPFALLMCVPLVGVFLFPLSQAACSTLLLNILGRNRLKDKTLSLTGEKLVTPRQMSFDKIEFKKLIKEE